MRKRHQRGGNDMKDITSNPIIILSGALVFIFTVIIPVLLYMNYEFIVQILTGVYGFFLFIFSAGVVSTDLTIASNFFNSNEIYIDTKKHPTTANENKQDIYYSIILADSILFGIITVLSIGMIVLANIYKHRTVLFPVTIVLILFVVLIRISQVPLEKSSVLYTIPKVVILVFAFATFLITILNQVYINTSGSNENRTNYQ
jgi:hypothetical protein